MTIRVCFSSISLKDGASWNTVRYETPKSEGTPYFEMSHYAGQEGADLTALREIPEPDTPDMSGLTGREGTNRDALIKYAIEDVSKYNGKDTVFVWLEGIDRDFEKEIESNFRRLSEKGTAVVFCYKR